MRGDYLRCLMERNELSPTDPHYEMDWTTPSTSPTIPNQQKLFGFAWFNVTWRSMINVSGAFGVWGPQHLAPKQHHRVGLGTWGQVEFSYADWLCPKRIQTNWCAICNGSNTNAGQRQLQELPHRPDGTPRIGTRDACAHSFAIRHVLTSMSSWGGLIPSWLELSSMPQGFNHHYRGAAGHRISSIQIALTWFWLDPTCPLESWLQARLWDVQLALLLALAVTLVASYLCWELREGATGYRGRRVVTWHASGKLLCCAVLCRRAKCGIAK